MNNDSNNNTQDSTEPRLPRNCQEFWEHLTGYETDIVKREIAKRSNKYTVVGNIINSLAAKSGGRLKNNLAWLALARIILRIGIDFGSGIAVNILSHVKDSANFISEQVTDNPIIKDAIKTCIAVIFNSGIPKKPYIAFIELLWGLYNMLLHGLWKIVHHTKDNLDWLQALITAFLMLCPIMAFGYFMQIKRYPVSLTVVLLFASGLLTYLAYQGQFSWLMGHEKTTSEIVAALSMALICFCFLFGTIHHINCLWKGFLQVLKF